MYWICVRQSGGEWICSETVLTPESQKAYSTISVRSIEKIVRSKIDQSGIVKGYSQIGTARGALKQA